MKKFKALFKMMNDDLKDSEMAIESAYKIKEEDPKLAQELASYAQQRLNHFMEFHKIFQELTKEVKIGEDTIGTCLWEETHEDKQEWYRSIQHKIEKF